MEQKLGYYSATLRLKLLLGLGLLLLASGAVWAWAGPLRLPLLLGLATGFIASYNQYLSAVAQTEAQYATYNLVLSFNTLRLLLITGLAAWGWLQLGACYAVFAVAPLLLAAWPTWRLGRDLGRAPAPPEPHFYAQLVRFGRWMIALALLETLYQRLDVLLVRWLSGAEAAGHYSSALAFFGIVYLLPTYVAVLSYPRFVEAVSRGDDAGLEQHYHLATELVAVISIPLALGLWAVSPEVVTLALGAKYAAAQTVFAYLAAYSLFWALQINSGAVFLAKDRPQDVVLIVAAALGVSAGLGLWLIPKLGIIGAGWSVSAAMAVSLALYWGLIRVKFKLTPRWRVVGMYLAAGGCMFLAVRLLPQGGWAWLLAKIAMGGVVYTGLLLVAHRFVPGGTLPLGWKTS
jgi:O-antigen/teichoic acid export membrane protein